MNDQFDFWLGEWSLTWGEDGRGTNRIERILGDHVIQETFNGQPGAGMENGLRGLSMTVYDRRRGLWCQTWVDDNGSYLDFTGGMEGDQMILQRETVIEDHPVKQRMVWYNITPDALEWNWERSDDSGDSWRVLWHIRYMRKP